ncbi:MAG: PQQ-binding-like beta-propeller repeat protein [Deltaproteobacteria bacterium]|nr:PQQ-binding-like beta-propeller repeat protein [Deltaproteobacteria bacterium]
MPRPMPAVITLALLVALLALPGPLPAARAEGAGKPSPAAGEWKRDWLVPGGPFRGIHGLAVGADGLVYVGSVMGQATYRVDPKDGRTELFIGAPEGMADDLEFAADGTLYFTGFMHGTLSARTPDGAIHVLASGLPGTNSLALDGRGRLFATQVFSGDALYEIDRSGKAKPRLIQRDLGGLNGFDFGPDGRLCGPLWFRKQVVCLDVDRNRMEVVADGFEIPAAANFDPKGELHAIDNVTGEIFRIDRAHHRKTRIATAPTGLDNLTFAPDGRLFVTNMPDNALYEIDRKTGAVRTVVGSPLTLPGGIARAENTLYVADTFAFSAVDLGTGAVRDVSRDGDVSEAPSIVAASAIHLATASLHRQSVLLWDRATERPIARWSELGQPSAIALAPGPGPRIAVATADGRLLELDPAKPEERRELARDLALPMGIARTARGWLVAEAKAGRLIELADDGSRRVVASDLGHPEGIAILEDGRIAVAETAGDRVTLVDSETGRKQTIATGLPLATLDLPGMPPGIFPTGLAAGEDGALLLSSDVEGGVLRLRKGDEP